MSIRQIRESVALWLLGDGPHNMLVSEMTEELYQQIWPKHDDYAVKNRGFIRFALVRSYLRGKRQARHELR